MENLAIFKFFTKIPSFLFIGIFIFTSILLFTPDNFLEDIGLNDYRLEYKSFIGVLFLLSLSIMISKLLISIWEKIRSKSRFRANRKIQLEYLESLTYEELTYLKPYIFEGKNTLYFVSSDGVAGGLVQKGILYRSSNNGDMLNGFPYNIQPWAKDELINKNINFNEIGRRQNTPYEDYLSF